MDATHGNAAAAQLLAKAAMEEAAAALSVRRVDTMDNMHVAPPDDGLGHTLDARMVSVLCVSCKIVHAYLYRVHVFLRQRAC